MENREWCYTYFFMLLFMCSISGNIWSKEDEVKNFHCLFQLMKRFKKKMININCGSKSKLAEYPCHLDGTFEDYQEE